MRFYLSHAIRGKYGVNATHAQMKINCDKAILIANCIRNALVSSVEIYVPAESEPFVGRAYQQHYLSEQQILEIDCSIIDACDGIIAYVPKGDELQGGRLVEVNHARSHNIPVFIFDNVEQIINQLAEYILRC